MALLLYNYKYQLHTIIGLVLLQMVLVVISRPYSIVGYTLRPMLNLTINLLIYTIYLLMPYPVIPNYNYYAPFAIVGLLGVCLLYNIYYFFLKIKVDNEPSTVNKKTDHGAIVE
jgi:hypothetical protein